MSDKQLKAESIVSSLSTDGITQQTSGLGVRECALKEGLEEANLDADYAEKRMVSAGIVTLLYDVSRGIYPCGEFVFDLELDKVDNVWLIRNTCSYLCELQPHSISGLCTPK